MRLKALTHGSQREPGTVWDEPDNIAEILIKLGHAEKVTDEKTYKTADVKPPVEDGITSLRAEYEKVTGKRPFYGWGEETLREKIAGYDTRAMRADT